MVVVVSENKKKVAGTKDNLVLPAYVCQDFGVKIDFEKMGVLCRSNNNKRWFTSPNTKFTCEKPRAQRAKKQTIVFLQFLILYFHLSI